jgi:hypothetical protein
MFVSPKTSEATAADNCHPNYAAAVFAFIFAFYKNRKSASVVRFL